MKVPTSIGSRAPVSSDEQGQERPLVGADLHLGPSAEPLGRLGDQPALQLVGRLGVLGGVASHGGVEPGVLDGGGHATLRR